MLIVTTVAQYARWSHGSRYPVSANARIRPRSARPDSHVTSRGGLYDPNTMTRSMCAAIATTMKLAPK